MNTWKLKQDWGLENDGDSNFTDYTLDVGGDTIMVRQFFKEVSIDKRWEEGHGNHLFLDVETKPAGWHHIDDEMYDDLGIDSRKVEDFISKNA